MGLLTIGISERFDVLDTVPLPQVWRQDSEQKRILSGVGTKESRGRTETGTYVGKTAERQREVAESGLPSLIACT